MKIKEIILGTVLLAGTFYGNIHLAQYLTRPEIMEKMENSKLTQKIREFYWGENYQKIINEMRESEKGPKRNLIEGRIKNIDEDILNWGSGSKTIEYITVEAKDGKELLLLALQGTPLTKGNFIKAEYVSRENALKYSYYRFFGLDYYIKQTDGVIVEYSK